LKTNQEIRVLISGGGTGGHLFPAIAIADAIKEKLPNARFLFVGANGKIEMEKVPQAGYEIVGMPITGFQRSLSIRNLSFPLRLVYSMYKAFATVKSFKPHIAIGTGGYASGPTLKAAELMGIPTVVQEQNAFPGVTNKLLGKKAARIFAGFEGLEKYFDANKIMVTGNPLRKQVSLDAIDKSTAVKHFGLADDKPVIFITGGSLGARAINKAVAANLELFNQAGVQLIWQCGKIYENEYMPFNSETVKVLTFIDKMDHAYAAADIIVSRAGASTISELTLIGKATIMLPSPNVAEDHQTKNVLSLVAKDAAIMVKDEEGEANLGKIAIDLLADEVRRKTLGRNMKALAKPHAANDIANEILRILKIEIPGVVKPATAPFADVKSVYFLGIGGIGMSALARYFNQNGKVVKGYDKTHTALTDQLQAEGIEITFEDEPTTLDKEADLVVFTPAIPKNSVQLNFYQSHNYKVLKRSQVLGMITHDKFCVAVAGSHGKTTVSSMIAHLLNQSIGCTAFLGGIANNFKSNYVASKGEIVVVEADEFDRSFLTLKPNIAVVTSVDSDHLDVYGSLENVYKEFQNFTDLIPSNGTLIHKNSVMLQTQGKKMSYSVDGSANVAIARYEVKSGGYKFDIKFHDTILKDFELNIGGRHNVENALAAITVAIELGVKVDVIKKALASFTGIRRRFEKVFESEKCTYIDDYAHHPNEIKALLESVKELYPGKKITTVFQPHLFSRTRDLAFDFAVNLSLSDHVVLLPIYPAREEPIEGVSSELILEKINAESKQILDKSEIIDFVTKNKPEVLLTVGAGDIDRLVEPLKKFLNQNKTA
jgi:UDP-N-acetylmuramate--alanine ligase